MFAANAVLKPTDDTLHIKQERDFVVKTENDLDEHPFILEDIKVEDMDTQINQLRDEKEKIIRELVNIKADNQSMNLDIQRKVAEIEQLKQQCSNQKSYFDTEINRLKNEMSVLKKKISVDIELQANYDKIISNMNVEKRELLARLKQVQQSVNENVMCDQSDKNDCDATSDQSDNEFEVECIYEHRMIRGKPEYHVRWKGYSKEHDSWEKAKNLTNCSTILAAYLKKQKK